MLMQPARERFFNEEYLSQFDDQHRTVYAEGEVDPHGQPDQGTGWYSKKFKLFEFVAFNHPVNAQYEALEVLPIIILCGPISCIYYPTPALVFIWVYALSRIIETIVPNKWAKRFMGLCRFGLVVTAIMTPIALMSRQAKRVDTFEE